MDKEVLALKKAVSKIEVAGRAGVKMDGARKVARNKTQDRILRLLLEKPERPEDLEEAIRAAGSGLDGAGAALALADFILDFRDYLC